MDTRSARRQALKSAGGLLRLARQYTRHASGGPGSDAQIERGFHTHTPGRREPNPFRHSAQNMSRITLLFGSRLRNE